MSAELVQVGGIVLEPVARGRVGIVHATRTEQHQSEIGSEPGEVVEEERGSSRTAGMADERRAFAELSVRQRSPVCCAERGHENAV